MENTLIILKPDCLQKGHAGTVLSRFEAKGYRVKACKVLRFNDALLREHYAHHATKPYFPEIAAFMTSSPLWMLVLEGEDVVSGVRSLLGPTDSAKAPAGTLRGDLGTDIMRNVAHASDSVETAREEIARFFTQEELSRAE